MTDALDLDAIEARANAATEGPWWLFVESDGAMEIRYGDAADDRDSYDLLDRYSEDDYRFLAAARDDVPALIARIRELESKLSATTAAAEWRMRAIEEMAAIEADEE